MKKLVRLMMLIVLFLSLLLPHGAAQELLLPRVGDRCPVCNMKVTPHPEWLAVVIFHDETYNFFDGTKCMFNMLFDFERYLPGYEIEDVKLVQVTEYATHVRHDARDVYFVAGSDVLGPMEQELIPVAGLDALKTFVSKHGHSRVMRFDGKRLIQSDPLH